jgi:hypothetical protein
LGKQLFSLRIGQLIHPRTVLFDGSCSGSFLFFRLGRGLFHFARQEIAAKNPSRQRLLKAAPLQEAD